MNSLEEKILSAETKHVRKLEKEIKAAFKNVWLPSHDLNHHIRVWSYAKELLQAFGTLGNQFTYEFVEALMIACYFHDVGLTKSLSPDHGRLSVEFANKYQKQVDLRNTLVPEMLQAIELHDNKSYSEIDSFKKDPTLYALLTVADDLDAFDAIGVLRYLEIYCLRDMDTAEIVKAIRINIDRRHTFVNHLLDNVKYLQQKHLRRYKISKELLDKLKNSDIRKIKAIFSTQTEFENLTPIELIKYNGLRELRNSINIEV